MVVPPRRAADVIRLSSDRTVRRPDRGDGPDVWSARPRPGCRRRCGRVVKPKREPGAEPDRLGGLIEETRRNIGVANDREAPVVEGDHLRQHLRAQAAPVAGDRVEPQPGTRDHGVLRGGTGSTPGGRRPQHQPWACRSISGPNTASALRTMRTAPSGWWRAPRPSVGAIRGRGRPGWYPRPAA